MDATLELQLPTVSLVEMLPDEVKSLLAEAGLTITELQRLADPRERVVAAGWIA